VCIIGGAAYRLGCVHLCLSAPLCLEHSPTYRLLNYCAHIRICSSFTDDLTKFPYDEMIVWAGHCFIQLYFPDDGPLMGQNM
jgi:hypothetical protein